MKVNKSKTYLSYYINKYIPIEFHNKLKNTYIAFNDEYYYWCMLYEFSGKLDFTTYEEKLENNPYYVKTIDTDKTHVLYIFSIPEELNDVINLFVSGKYSKLPDRDDLIKYLVRTYNLPLNHDIVRILRKDPKLKERLENELDVIIDDDLDLSDLPDLNSENYIFSK